RITCAEVRPTLGTHPTRRSSELFARPAAAIDPAFRLAMAQGVPNGPIGTVKAGALRFGALLKSSAVAMLLASASRRVSGSRPQRSEEHTSELQPLRHLV